MRGVRWGFAIRHGADPGGAPTAETAAGQGTSSGADDEDRAALNEAIDFDDALTPPGGAPSPVYRVLGGGTGVEGICGQGGGCGKVAACSISRASR
jgi:hypothetical protein